ncbi:MAG TPA: hypothetical protein VF147_15940 [Vicinamibacterales bacterium]
MAGAEAAGVAGEVPTVGRGLRGAVAAGFGDVDAGDGVTGRFPLAVVPAGGRVAGVTAPEPE